MDDKLKYALIIAFVLNSAFLFSNFPEKTPDSYEHIFFANHYQTSWLDTWESKWYGGFTVVSYPPLAHQTIALLSFITGLEWSYKILTLVLMTIFPLAIFFFSKIFVSEKAAIYAAVMSGFIPSVLQASYTWGQFPTLFGLVAGLITIVFLNKFLTKGSWLNLLISLSLLGVSVSSHHFTAVFLVPVLIVVLVFDKLLRRNELSAVVLIKRILLFLLLGFALCAVIIYPYWNFALFESIKMTPIPHLSRINILSDKFAFELFFWNMYGPILFLIPGFFVLVVKNKNLLPLFLGAFLLFVLGLGAATPLPQLLLGEFGEMLTYDRFSLWAGIMFLPLCGLFLAQFQNRFEARKFYRMVLVVFLVSLMFTSLYAANRSLNQNSGINISTMDPVIEFLNAPQTQDWRYLTLGLGEPAMLKLSIYTNAKNIDGNYFFVRSDPLLSVSGIGQLDNAKFYGQKALTILDEVLQNASNYNLRWIICGDPTYYQMLENNSFVRRWSQDSTSDGRFGGVTIWESKEVPPEYVPSKPENRTVINDYLWGIGPPIILLSSILLVIIKKVKK